LVVGRKRFNGKRIRNANGKRTRCITDCCDALACADFSTFDGLTGEVDYSTPVTAGGGADACCDDIFAGASGAPATWSYIGLTGSGGYTSAAATFCPFTFDTYLHEVFFACVGDGTFELTINVIIDHGATSSIWSWSDTFPEPFAFNTTYTLTLLGIPGDDIYAQCLYDTGGWSAGDASILFTVPS
jgi:hypothetical protein